MDAILKIEARNGGKAIYQCLHCQSPFPARVCDRKRGRAIFCGKSCKALKQEAAKGAQGHVTDARAILLRSLRALASGAAMTNQELMAEAARQGAPVKVGMPSDEWLVAASKRFSYDPETGVLRNLKNGKVLGAKSKRYVRGTFLGRPFSVHQMAWYLHNGAWPSVLIDHKNRVTNDNRISNLRLATHAENCRNSLSAKAPESGYRGVYIKRKGNLTIIESAINFCGKKHHIGKFKTRIEAAQAYNQVASELFGEFAVLNSLTPQPPEGLT